MAIVVALPIAPPEIVSELSQEADRIVCLAQPPHFRALGYYYRNFEQLEDEDVLAALGRGQEGRDAATSKGNAAEENPATADAKKKR